MASSAGLTTRSGLVHAAVSATHENMANNRSCKEEPTLIDTRSYEAFIRSAPFAAKDVVCYNFSAGVQFIDDKFIEAIKGTFFEDGAIAAFARGLFLTLSLIVRIPLYLGVVSGTFLLCLLATAIPVLPIYLHYTNLPPEKVDATPKPVSEKGMEEL
ncbi:MAG: hypothetical protein HYX48_05375 [Chlamydiales bacterium]|nr:hypothetical protein [Chlamydiales bacterium]